MIEVEIFCDASIKKFPNGRSFGCAGAIAPNFNLKKIEILPDATNNKSEITAIYLAVKLAKEIADIHGKDNCNITIYSDSKISVFGLREWIDSWILNTHDGIMYNSSNIPVANQFMFIKIFIFLVENDIKIKLNHQKGHVDGQSKLQNAKNVFFNSNGFNITDEHLIKICNYNNLIDNLTRQQLEDIDCSQYPIIIEPMNIICRYKLPNNYKSYIS